MDHEKVLVWVIKNCIEQGDTDYLELPTMLAIEELTPAELAYLECARNIARRAMEWGEPYKPLT